MDNSGELHVEGRVTRSLRKRLASIDSDTQSRPSTPMLTKLDPINELNSPSRSVRRTRRNSTNTPAKTAAKTPSKAAQNRAALTVEVASEEGTPMRRTTRRHSTSISIIEEEKNTIKSVALQIDALPEENSPNQSNSLGRRVTRSTSKSPQQPAEEEKSTTITHSGKKSSKTESQTRTKKCSDEEMSDVEIVNLEEIENQKKANKGNDNKPFQKLKKPVPEKDAREKTRNEIKKQPREKDNSFKKYLKSNLTAEFEFVEDELRTEEDNLIESEINTSKKQTSPETKTKDIYLDSDVDHLFDEHNLLIDLDEEGIEIETYRRDGKDSPADLANESGENETSTSNKRSPIVITDDVKLQRITPERIAHYANIKGTGKDSPKPSGNYPSRDAVKDATEIIKCVNFKETSDDTSIKSSYPTTPFVVKSKSYIERNLLREAYKKSCAKTLLENNDIAEPTEESELLDIAKSLIEDGDVEEEFVEVLKTPNKTTLNVIQSSTPLFLNASETQDEQKEITNQIEYDKINSTEKLPKTNIKQAEALKQSEEEEPLKRTSLLETQKQEAHKLLDKSNLDENLLAKELLKDTSKSHLRSANKTLKDLNEKQFEENSVANEKLEETPKTNLRSANKSLKDNEKQFSESLVAEERLKDTSKTHLHSANKSLKDLNEKQFEENSVGNEKLEEAPKTNLRSANKSLKDLNEKQFSESLVADEEEVPKSNLRSANKSLKNVNEKQMDVNLLAEERLKDTSKSHLRSANKSLKDLIKKQFEENSVANEKLQDAPKTNLRSANKSLKDLNEKQFSESLVADEHLEENNSDNKITPKEKQSFASSWTQVAVKTGGKIDEIFIEQPQRIITPPQLMNISNDDDVIGNNKSTEKIEPHKSPTFEPDDNKSCSEDEEDEDEDEDNGIEDDEPIEELAADEEPYNNCSLVLDEAMEADDDYQSGDSMDSEELREMKENEIPVDYESIGSGDTTEDEGEDDEDDDASFIVQDSETERAENSCFMYSDDDEHLLDGERKNKKNRHKYKRVLTIESSDSEQEEESGSSRSSFEKDNQLISKSNTTAKEHIIEATLDNLEFPNKEQEQLTLPNVQVSKIEKASTVEEKEKASMDSTEPRERPPKTVKRNSDFLITIVDSKVDCKENKKLIKSNISIESEDEEYESAEMLPLVINDDDDDEHNEDGDFKPNLDNKSGKSLNSSKLSETALKLQEDTSEENTDHQDENNQYNKLNLSQKHLIKKLHPSERLNKTIHELRGANEQEDNSSSDCEPFPVRVTRRATSLGGKNEQNKMLRNSLRKNRSKKLYPVATNETVLSSGEEGRQTTENEEVASSKRRSGFGKSTSKQLESNNESDVEENEDSDETKEIRNRKEMDEFHELTDEDNTKSKHVLSVSFGQTKDLNKSNAAQAEVAHSSSTIRVSVTKKNRGITTPEPLNTSQSSLQDDDDDGTDQEESSTTSNTKMAEFSSAEDEELLSKLSNDVTQSQKIRNRRHSFVNTEVASAKKTIPTTETKASQLNLRKRNSSQIYLKDVDTSSDDFNPSQSLVENLKERKQELSEKNSAKRKRLSKSFCEGVGVGALDTTEHGEVRHLHKKLKQSNAQEKTSQNNDRPKTHIQKILGRCDEILEAANRAKLESKQNFNKSTVKLLKPKKVKKIIVEPVKDNEEKLEEENEILIQKELKRQEQAKVEIEKALHASANIMMKKPLSTKTKLVVSQDVSVAAAAAKGSSNPDSITTKPKKSKAPHLSILPSANDNRSHQHAPHKLKSSAGEVIEVPITEKKKKSHNEIKLSTGIVRVESLTPKKQRLQSGFRESPATPRSLGFKVRHILTIGQDTPPEIPAVLRKDGKRKRRKIEEPRNTLPKPQWTQSGIFMEEDLYPSIPVASTGSTQFMVSTLNDGRKRVKKSVTAADAGKGKSSSSNSALLFKKNALFRDNIPRETSHELLLRKQRQQFHSHY